MNNSLLSKFDNEDMAAANIESSYMVSANSLASQRLSKLIIFVLLTLGIYLGKEFATPTDSVSCMNDPLHNFLGPVNDRINYDSSFARGLQISSSLMMDLTYIILFLYWVLYVKTARLIITMVVFYGVRAINQLLIQMRYPDGFYWEYPGFPSYVVPYGKTSDFFFSGHTGFLMICSIEWYMLGKKKMFYLTISILAYMIFVLLSFRTHYAIDITTALVIAHYLSILVQKYEATMNSFFLKIYYFCFSVYYKRCKKQEEESVV